MAFDIDYGQILKKSWDTTKRNKWLWIYGVTLAVFGGSGSLGSGGGSGNSFDSWFKDLPKNIPEDLPQKTSHVLGFYTNQIGGWLKSVSLETWLTLTAGLIIILFLSILLTWFLRLWAKGALIGGLALAEDGKNPTLASTSPLGLKHVKALFTFSLIAFALTVTATLAIILTTGSVIGMAYLFLKEIRSLEIIIIIFSVLIGVVTLVATLVLLSMVAVYAERLIVIKNYSAWAAWKKGLNLSRKGFIATLIMGLINQSVSCIVGCLSIIILIACAIPAVVIFVAVIKTPDSGLRWLFFGIIVFLFIAFIYINFLLQGITAVFTYSNWNLFFKEILAREGEK